MMVVGIKDQNGDVSPFGYNGQREYYLVVHPSRPACEIYFIYEDGEVAEAHHMQDNTLRNIATGSWDQEKYPPVWVLNLYKKHFNISSYERV